MDVEPVANVEILNLQKWLEKPKEWKMMKKWIENTAGGGITAKECNPIYIYIYILTSIKLTNNWTKQYQMLSNH